MIICEVFQSGKLYVFKSKCQISKGTHVMVDTAYGESYGLGENVSPSARKKQSQTCSSGI